MAPDDGLDPGSVLGRHLAHGWPGGSSGSSQGFQGHLDAAGAVSGPQAAHRCHGSDALLQDPVHLDQVPGRAIFPELSTGAGRQAGDRGRVGPGSGRERLDGVAFPAGDPQEPVGDQRSQRVADLQAAARVLKPDHVGQLGELPDDLGPVILDRQGVAVPHVDEDSHSHGRGHPVHVLVDTSSGRAAVRGANSMRASTPAFSALRAISRVS